MTFLSKYKNIVIIKYKNLVQYIKNQILKKDNETKILNDVETQKQKILKNFGLEVEKQSYSIKMISQSHYRLFFMSNNLPLDTYQRLKQYLDAFLSFFKSPQFYRNFKTYKLLVFSEYFIEIIVYVCVFEDEKTQNSVVSVRLIEKCFHIDVDIKELNNFVTEYDKLVCLFTEKFKAKKIFAVRIDIK